MTDRRGFGRRAFLRGAGVAVGLPLLASLRPRRALAAEAEVRRRLLVIYTPNGMNMADWTPAGGETGFPLSPILSPLSAPGASGPIRDKVLVLSGLANRPAGFDSIGKHAPATGSFLTCAKVNRSGPIRNKISMDQVAASAIGGATRMASLQLGMGSSSNVGTCDAGWSCVYTRNISWSGPTSPMPKMVEPQAVFDLMFAGSDPGVTAEEIARRRVLKRSVLDSVLDDANRVHGKLGASDRAKLDQYLTGVRELERQLQHAGAPVCAAPVRPTDDPDFPTKVRQMLDLMVMAVQCDLTRVVTYMMGSSLSGQSFPFAGVNEGHHQTSHHRGIATNLARLTKIDRWQVEQYVYLLQKLDALDDGGGATVLDNSLVYFSSEFSDGHSHSNSNLPILLAGRGGSNVASGRHVRYQGGRLADLYISMLAHLGLQVNQFGDDGTGPLGQLT